VGANRIVTALGNFKDNNDVLAKVNSIAKETIRTGRGRLRYKPLEN